MNIETHPKLLSLLIPAFNSEKRLRPAYEALRDCLEKENIPLWLDERQGFEKLIKSIKYDKKHSNDSLFSPQIKGQLTLGSSL